MYFEGVVNVSKQVSWQLKAEDHVLKIQKKWKVRLRKRAEEARAKIQAKNSEDLEKGESVPQTSGRKTFRESARDTFSDSRRRPRETGRHRPGADVDAPWDYEKQARKVQICRKPYDIVRSSTYCT